jgi:hypothetical protein
MLSITSLLDVEVGDRLTVDKRHDLLRGRSGRQYKHARTHQGGNGDASAVEAE